MSSWLTSEETFAYLIWSRQGVQESYTCERFISVFELVCTEAAIFVSMRHWHNPEHVASLSAGILGKSYIETTHYFLGGKLKKKRKIENDTYDKKTQEKNKLPR